MKKLMTTLSAVAVAFGLYAAGPSDTGTSFEGLPGDADGIAYDIYAEGGDDRGGGELTYVSGETYWVTNATSTLKVKEGSSGTDVRPDQFLKARQQRYLDIKTTLGNPVSRKVYTSGEGATIGSDVNYFDSLVKFTAFDTDPTCLFAEEGGRTVITNGGKIAIWLKENYDANENPISTNLMITAGYLVGGSVVATNYECYIMSDNINLNDGGWHRVTVRAIDNIYTAQQSVPGFVVFIDECYVACDATKDAIDENQLDSSYSAFYNAGVLFPSAVQGEDSYKSVIRSVEFDGQGCVDDLVFTPTKPDFVEDIKSFTITLGEGVESVGLDTRIGGTPIASGCGTFTSDLVLTYEASMYVTVTGIVYKAGYIAGDVATNGNVTVETIVEPTGSVNRYSPEEGDTGIEVRAKRLGATVIINEEATPYATVAEAMAVINAVGFSGSATLVLNTAALDGIEIDNPNAEVVLDLAGNDITNETKAAAILLTNGSLTIVDSADEVAHVVGNGVESVYACAGTTLAIDEGIYDGAVYHEDEYEALFEITGGIFEKDANELMIGYLTAAVKAGLGSTYGLVPDGDYYVIDETGTTWTVTFMDGETEYDSVDVDDGESVAKPEDPTKTGYKFLGWYEDGEAEEFDFTTLITNNITLYADWSAETYTITYNLDLAGATNATDYVDEFTVADTVALLPAGCVGYTFNGWTNSAGQVVSGWDAGDVTDDVELYASWTADSYMISYLNGDGTPFKAWKSGYDAPASYTVVDTVTLPVADNLNLGVGVTFQNWTNETGEVTGWAAGEKTGAVTVYAKLEEIVGPTPITPGTGVTTVEVEATDAADALTKVVVTPPTGSGIDTPEERADYEALFDITAEAVSGKPGYYDVSITLKDTVLTGVNTDAVAVFSGDTSVTVPQGLYYRITPSTSLPIASVGEGVVSDGSAISVAKPGTTKGFLKIELSASPIPAPAAE